MGVSMLTKEELNHWYQHLNLSPITQAIIDRIRVSEPSRLVQSSRGNVSGRFPSKKMQATIQFESHRNELAFIYEMEHNPLILEFYDQPPSIKLIYLAKNGKQLGVLHTPDFFVIRNDSAGWEECKTEEELVKLAEKSPNRYCLNQDAEWYSPPGETYAQAYGLYYRIRSSKEINWSKQRNLYFLEDYLRSEILPVDPYICNVVLAIISSKEGISLIELFLNTEGIASRDDIYKLIITKQIYVDLDAAPIVEPERVLVFTNKEMALTHNKAINALLDMRARNFSYIDLKVGTLIIWDGKSWKIANVGNKMISLLGEENAFIELPLSVFETLIKEERVARIVMDKDSSLNEKISSLLSKTSFEGLREANRRSDIILRHLRGEPLAEDKTVATRTLYHWKRLYKEAENLYGQGYLGLLPKKRGSTGRSQLPNATRELMLDFIKTDYASPKQKRKFEVWAALKLACDQQGIVCPSYKTFSKAIGQQNNYKQTLNRQGYKAAYNHKPFYWDLNEKTPKHGDRPFEICHIDHTQMDIELLCSQTKQNLGRPWATFLTDAYSRRILAIYITYDQPSYRSCMMVLRECVRLYRRLPQNIVVDNGAEFKSIYFDSLLARYECIKKLRPVSNARFGSTIERLFGTTNTQFIYNLKGNTQLTKNVRQLTKALNPQRQAIWTLERFYERLCEYVFSVYDINTHPALGQSPKEAYRQGIELTGNRPYRSIPYDKNFIISTLPTTRKGTAKVLAGRGVKINFIMYWNSQFRNPEIENKSVQVRYDPFNAGIAYTFVAGQWIECFSEYYTVFQNRTEKELMVATDELRESSRTQSKQISITAKNLANFLQSIEAEEKLKMQSLRDKESQSIQSVINGNINIKPDKYVTQMTNTTSNLSDQSKANNELEAYEDF